MFPKNESLLLSPVPIDVEKGSLDEKDAHIDCESKIESCFKRADCLFLLKSIKKEGTSLDKGKSQ